MSHSRTCGDEGGSLLFVLVFLLLLSGSSLLLLSFTQVSYEASETLHDLREENYAADAAIELGIRKILDDPTGTLGTSADDCAFTFTNPQGVATEVTCRPASASSGTAGRPDHALLTLARTEDEDDDDEYGILVQGSNKLTISGAAYSNSRVEVASSSNSRLAVIGSLTAREDDDGDCSTSRVTATAGKDCDAAATAPDPAWSVAAGNTTTLATVTCTTVGTGGSAHRYAVFTPGRYTSMPTSMLSLRGSSCNDRRTLYFQPGVHYLHDVDLLDTGNNVSVVAGTPKAGHASVPATDGSACVQTSPGAQFVLGAGAEIDLNGGTLTMCAGPVGGTQPPIAIYGVRTTTASLTRQNIGETALDLGNTQSAFIHGSVYMPRAQADIRVHNKDRTQFTGGIVVHSLLARVSASSTQLDAPISLPPCDCNRRVVLEATVEGDTAPWVRAVVDIDDGDGATPGLSSSVASWAVLR